MTAKLAVFGNPIAHSLSPVIHGLFGELAGIDLHYAKRLVSRDDFAAAARDFFADGGMGINITVPFKIDAYDFVDIRSALAEDAGAVNTIVRQRDGLLRGENTDGGGLVADLLFNLGWALEGKSILILGAGGAVQGVLRSLLDQAPSQIVIANRTYENAVKLVKMAKNDHVQARRLDELLEPFDIIISGSSAGLGRSNETMSLPATLLTATTCVYDMIYGVETPFLRWAKDLPASQKADGLGMLVEQAAIAFELWFDVKVETRSVLDQIRKQS